MLVTAAAVCHISTPARNKLIIYSTSGVNHSISLHRGKCETAYSKESDELENLLLGTPHYK